MVRRSGRPTAALAGPIRRVQGIRGRLAVDTLRRRRGRLSQRDQPSRSRARGRREPQGRVGHRESVQRLGVTALLGRNIRAEDDSLAAAPVVAISYELWQRRYGTNPTAVGRVLTIRGQAATVVALMPRGFGFPAQTEVWATARPFRPVAETGPSDFYVYLVGRLAPGATVEQSASELTNYLKSNLARLPATLRGMTASGETFDADLLGDVCPVIRLLLVASALVIGK